MFIVGQQIIALKDHSTGIVKRGDIFTVYGVRSGICPCTPVLLDIGIERNEKQLACFDCGVFAAFAEPNNWIAAWIFMPLNAFLNTKAISMQLINALKELDCVLIHRQE